MAQFKTDTAAIINPNDPEPQFVRTGFGAGFVVLAVKNGLTTITAALSLEEALNIGVSLIQSVPGAGALAEQAKLQNKMAENASKMIEDPSKPLGMGNLKIIK